MASPFCYAPESKGVLLITAGRTGSRVFFRSMVSGQDKAKVEPKDYNFGGHIIELIDALIATGLQTYDEDKKRHVQNVYRRQTLQLLDGFSANVAQGKLTVDKEHAVFMCRPDLLHLGHSDRKDHNVDPVREPLNQNLLEGEEDGLHDRAPCNLQWYTSSSTSVSVLPDDFLLSVTPVFLIRNPTFMIPSFCRTLDEITQAKLAITTLLWSRKMYEWYVASDPRFASASGKTPIVINSADFMVSADVRYQIALAMGLDPEKVLTSWPAASEEDKQSARPFSVRMGKTLLASTHLMAEKAVIGDEGWDKWKEEWGEEGASVLKKVVDEEMLHWEFLKSRAWVPSSCR